MAFVISGAIVSCGTSRDLLTYLLKIIADVANRQVTYESLSVMYSNYTFNN